VEALETKQAAAGEDASEAGGLGMTER